MLVKLELLFESHFPVDTLNKLDGEKKNLVEGKKKKNFYWVKFFPLEYEFSVKFHRFYRLIHPRDNLREKKILKIHTKKKKKNFDG